MKRFALRPTIREAAASLAAIAALVALLALIDERVREQGARMAADGMTGTLSSAGAQAQSAGWSVMSLLRDLSIEQMSLALFVIIATVLVIAMLRT